RQLEDAVIDDVSDLSRGMNVFRGMDYGVMLRRGVSLAALVVLIGAGAGMFPGHLGAFLNRLLLGSAHYPTRTQIFQGVINGKRVDLNLGREATIPCPYGQPLEFRVQGAGELPEQGTAKLWDLQSRVESKVDLTPAVTGGQSSAKPDAASPGAPRVAG